MFFFSCINVFKSMFFLMFFLKGACCLKSSYHDLIFSYSANSEYVNKQLKRYKDCVKCIQHDSNKLYDKPLSIAKSLCPLYSTPIVVFLLQFVSFLFIVYFSIIFVLLIFSFLLVAWSCFTNTNEPCPTGQSRSKFSDLTFTTDSTLEQRDLAFLLSSKIQTGV